jgi:hypothetical protein
MVAEEVLNKLAHFLFVVEAQHGFRHARSPTK